MLPATTGWQAYTRIIHLAWTLRCSTFRWNQVCEVWWHEDKVMNRPFCSRASRFTTSICSDRADMYVLILLPFDRRKNFWQIYEKIILWSCELLNIWAIRITGVTCVTLSCPVWNLCVHNAPPDYQKWNFRGKSSKFLILWKLHLNNKVKKRWKSEIVDRGCVISSQEHHALKITHS